IAFAILLSWLALWLIGESPLGVTAKVMEPLILGFTTRSSEVTLPVHMEKLQAMGAPDKVVSVVLPLGY
ncbi:cation:dicarboxylate symporter family transporter, partial [Klebsiella pneumoniae]|uniref:cation:dicarboxylate symporter family transporter n=1 Tax=Klebsiella pneumoniae TaxID=573 RepID=UPI0013D2F2F7